MMQQVGLQDITCRALALWEVHGPPGVPGLSGAGWLQRNNPRARQLGNLLASLGHPAVSAEPSAGNNADGCHELLETNSLLALE